MKSSYLLSGMLCAAIATILFSCKKTPASLQADPNNITAVNAGAARFSLVPLNLARQIAAQRPKDSVDVRLTENLTALKPRTIENEFTYNGKDGYPDYYAFNYSDGGFILISADLKTMPILAHAESGAWGRTAFPDGVQIWMRSMKGYIDHIRRQPDSVGKDILPLWNHLLPGQPLTSPPTAPAANRTAANVPPDGCTPNTSYFYYGTQISTAWGQGCGYNSNCPGDFYGPCGHDLTGCVATAIAQVAYYFRSPSRYDYGSMPLTAVSGSTSASLQSLMADAGTYVNMQYGPTNSGALATAIPGAFTTNLGYSTATLVDYNSAAIPTIENDIRFNNEPVIFTGFDNNGKGGHAWVGDGYAIAGMLSSQCTISYQLQYYHMNWGWGEEGTTNNYIGWYNYYAWNPDGYDFMTSPQVILDIHP
jgi:hypothetical protein